MSRRDDAASHQIDAQEFERLGDFHGARVCHMKCVESWKQAGDETQRQLAENAYAEFVGRDPNYRKLLSIVVPIIKDQPGVMQSEIAKRYESMDWSALMVANRPVAKEDIYYVLYFAERFGAITRTKKGRSYELRLVNPEAR